MEEVVSGQLRRIYKELRYGFISCQGKDYFFHKEDYLDDWHMLCKEHNEITQIDLDFEPTRTDKGLRARNVRMSEG